MSQESAFEYVTHGIHLRICGISARLVRAGRKEESKKMTGRGIKGEKGKERRGRKEDEKEETEAEPTRRTRVIPVGEAYRTDSGLSSPVRRVGSGRVVRYIFYFAAKNVCRIHSVATSNEKGSARISLSP